jgi:hypothetical protein
MGQDNYRYDQLGYGVHLTGDRSANGAQPLAGYPLDVRPDAAWPGLAGSGRVRVEPEEVKKVADWLTAQADSARSLPRWLSGATSVSFGPSSWHEANNLKAASELVSQAVADYLGQTVANLTDAAATLNVVHATYTGTEQANDHTVRSSSAALGGASDGSGGAKVM